MYKHRVKQDSSTAMTVGVLAHTTSGYIQDVRDVYDSLVHHFEAGTHRYRRRVVFNEHKFFLHLVADNPIHRPDETFTKLDKISEHYQFVVRNKGQMYERMRCCNCLPCMADMIEGPKEWVQSTHHVPECLMSSLGNRLVEDDNESAEENESNDNNNVYTFNLSYCTKTTGVGVATQRQEDRRSRHARAADLRIGDFVLWEGAVGDIHQPIWLGRVMSNPDWEGQGVKKNDTKRQMKFPGNLIITPGSVAVYIMWYEKIDVNLDVLDYHVSRDMATPMIQTNRYFICGGFDMHRQKGHSNPVPRLRKSTMNESRKSKSVYKQPRTDLKKSGKTWHNKEFGLVWRMDKVDREAAIAKVGAT